MAEIKIPDIKVSSFETDLKENDRLFFSSKYGKGKTTFLKYFFSDKEQEYLTISLNPVLYSVNDNLDVFKLLEVDIASELLRQLEAELIIPKEYVYAEIVNNRIHDVAGYIVQLIEKTGKPLHKGIIKLIKAIDAVKQKSEDEYNSLTSGNYGAVEYYLNVKEDDLPERGNLFSGVISNVLSEDSRKKVLIIDDLDRLDPDHLFRLLNVFSNSFYEDAQGEGVHKRLGFDKIVLVGHYDNIKGIFHHKYGEKVDFGGYFNKFHDKIHRFDYSSEAYSFIKENLKSDFGKPYDTIRGVLRSELEDILDVLAEMIFVLFQRNYIDWRTLEKKLMNNPLTGHHYPPTVVKAGIMPFVSVILYLSELVETPENLLTILEELAEVNEHTHLRCHSRTFREKIYSHVSPILAYNYLGGTDPLQERDMSLQVTVSGSSYTISVKLTQRSDNHFFIGGKHKNGIFPSCHKDGGAISPGSINFYELWSVFLVNILDKNPDILS